MPITASPDCREMARGGFWGVNVGIFQSHGVYGIRRLKIPQESWWVARSESLPKADPIHTAKAWVFLPVIPTPAEVWGKMVWQTNGSFLQELTVLDGSHDVWRAGCALLITPPA